MVFSNSCTTQKNLPGNVLLDIAIKFAPEIQDAILWPVVVHTIVFQNVHIKEKSGFLYTNKVDDTSKGFGFYFVRYGIVNKIAL